MSSLPLVGVAQPADRQELLLAAYESLLNASQRMLASARAADWDALVEQESEYLVRVERIRRMDAQLSLDDKAATRKAALLEGILEQDMEIRQRLVERRDELGRMIGNSRRQQALSRAYGPQQGAMPVDAGHRFGQQEP
ncbi:MAG: flagellar protein FliT [Halomonas sp.]|uniref:flagellar protein FliT n=1 Tax=Halomonas sp. TaxID=1486246 RepID=UPI003970F192